MSKGRTGRRWWVWMAAGAAVVAAALAVVAWMAARRAEPWLRSRIVAALEERFQARVELDGFHVWVAGGLWAEGKGLRIWPPAQAGGVAVPGPGQPLIRLEEFRFHTPLRVKPGETVHISTVELKGLTVDLPPKTRFAHGARLAQGTRPVPLAGLVRFQVDAMECAGALLRIETSKPGKLPLEVAIARLRLTQVSEDGPMDFEAELTNPRPTGQVRATGTLGPWQAADPGEMAVAGKYRFTHADLATIAGIAGTLESTGQFQGTLRELAVEGETDTPDFRLTHFGTALPLHTRFQATVDATNGDTWLKPVDARLGRSHFQARGEIVRVIVDGRSMGRDVKLDVRVDDGRVEDFLRLTSRSGTPLLTGALTMKTALDLPPGRDAIHQRLRLHGAFVLEDALFTSDKIQGRIAELSARGLGRPGDAKVLDPAGTRSAMHGSFSMSAGVLRLPDLEYSVPGATIALHGAYGMEGGTLDFQGTAKLQATVSQMVGGWKGSLLKPLDRYFQHDGAGAVVPIHLGGTRAAPDFGVDLKRFRLGASTPSDHRP